MPGETMGFVSIDWTLVFTLINTLILFLIMKHFLYKPVKKILNDREADIRKSYDDAQKAKQDADELKEEYTKKLALSKEEAAAIVKNATAKANTRSDEIIAEAKRDAAAITEKAYEDIKKEKKKAVNEAKNEISALAVEIAGKVIEKDISKDDHDRLIESFIDSLGNEQ